MGFGVRSEQWRIDISYYIVNLDLSRCDEDWILFGLWKSDQADCGW